MMNEAAGAPPFPRERSPYIVGRGYDLALFLLPPVVSLAVGWLLAGTAFHETSFVLQGRSVTGTTLLLGVLVHGHLAAVFLRSHGNGAIFRRHPFRFVVAPLALFGAMLVSAWVVAIVSVLVVFWDVYHSALQTFGLARMYDRNAGNDARAGRGLDLLLNLLLYAGPILAGATMLAHFESFEAFADVDATFLARVPLAMESAHHRIARVVVAGGAAFLVVYLVAYARLWARGHRVSWPKVWLLGTTGLCSVWAWGFNPWGQAFLVMNLFHAIQYFALVWWAEGGTVRRALHLETKRVGRAVAAFVFLGVLLLYGYWAEMVPSDNRVLWSVTQVVAILHFWYDGFLWSVRRKAI